MHEGRPYFSDMAGAHRQWEALAMVPTLVLAPQWRQRRHPDGRAYSQTPPVATQVDIGSRKCELMDLHELKEMRRTCSISVGSNADIPRAWSVVAFVAAQ